jgi:DHA1 family multidrug resistance protein-like MFS transporter
MAHAFFFIASAVWNFGLGMSWLVVPLYAHAQGLSNAEIGLLFGIPVLAQAPLNMVGGAYTDRIGGRRIMLGSCLVSVGAGLWFVVAQGFWGLLAGQLALVVSRASFWPATWAMASELSSARGLMLGRLNAVTNLGQILGTSACGFLLALTGYTPTFIVLAAIGLVAFVTGFLTRHAPHKPHGAAKSLLAAYRPLVGRPIILYSMVCAYISALPFSLTVSFYPLFLALYGYSEDASGLLMALRGVGSIAASLLASRLVRTGPETLWPLGCAIAVAAAVGLMPTINHALPIGTWMFLLGAGSAAMTLYFQITISEASGPEQRGAALAIGGLGWSASHMSTPLLLGFLADRIGLINGFYVLGALALATGIALVFMRQWAFARK